MAGIYIHIPFCIQKCIYCNFYSIPSLTLKHSYLDSLLKEIDIQKDYLSGQNIETIYLGGGTPSTLSVTELERLFTKLQSVFSISQTAEITLEANPEQLNLAYLTDLKHYLPVNRLSIGIQSFFDDLLTFLNRKHSVSQAINCVEWASGIGYANISVDLIYGIPNLTHAKWQKTLEMAFRLPIQHLSAYALTVEPQTLYDKMIAKGLALPPNEEQIIEQFEMLQSKLSSQNFVQYETSNFAKPGFESKHNSHYWSGIPYLGLGASAHSFNGTSRQWNFADVQAYISAMEKGFTVFEKEMLTPKDTFNEYIMLALRTSTGIEKAILQSRFSAVYQHHLTKGIQPLLEKGWLTETPNAFILTEKGNLFADGMAAELFLS